MDDELTRHVQTRAWNLARTMIANGATRELVALTFIQIADDLLPAEGSGQSLPATAESAKA